MLVDSLMSNEALIYEESKNRLIAMPSSQFKEGYTPGNGKKVEKSLVAFKGKNKQKADNEGTEKRIKCYYCHKLGHKGADCWKKQKKEKTGSSEKTGDSTASSENSKGGKNTEKALVASGSSHVSSAPRWKRDTGATAHMCDNLGEFIGFSESDNVVMVGGNIPLSSKG